MDNNELIREVNARANELKKVELSLADTERILKIIFDIIWDECAKNGEVRFATQGKFHASYRKPRAGHNPVNNETVTVDGHAGIAFTLFPKIKRNFEDEFFDNNREFVRKFDGKKGDD